MEQKGKLVVISGFSGAGKGTLMKALLAAHPDRYALSVSATTRDPRPGEKDGVDYFFVTDETFDSMIQKDEFLEYAICQPLLWNSSFLCGGKFKSRKECNFRD